MFKENLQIIPENTYCLSDIQFPHKKLLVFEYEQRIRKIGLNVPLKEYDEMSNSQKEEYIAKSLDIFLDIYKNKILSEKTKNPKMTTFIDLGDFVFNPSDGQISWLKHNGFLEKLDTLFAELKTAGISVKFCYGNHDKIEFKETIYDRYFDTQEDYYWGLNGKNLYIYTHEPLTEVYLEGKVIRTADGYTSKSKGDGLEKYKPLKEFILSKEREQYNIINVHGHTHSNPIGQREGAPYPFITYENACIDQFVKDASLDELKLYSSDIKDNHLPPQDEAMVAINKRREDERKNKSFVKDPIKISLEKKKFG